MSVDLWNLAYHLAGPTILAQTSSEPLGALPLPVRRAVLETVESIAPGTVEMTVIEGDLLFRDSDRLRPHAWIDWWRFKDESLSRLTGRAEGDHSGEFLSIHSYFQHFKLTKPEFPEEDEHYAERRFVKEAFVPVFGMRGLSLLVPQVRFGGKGVQAGLIDFVLQGERRYALEIEGAQYHAAARLAPSDHDRETARRRALAESGYEYRPFTYRDIISGRARDALQTLLNADARLTALRDDSPSALAPPSLSDSVSPLVLGLPDRYPLYQATVLRVLRDATLAGTESLTIADVEPVTGVLALAIVDTVATVEAVARLFGIRQQLPSIEVIVVGGEGRPCVKRLLQGCFSDTGEPVLTDPPETRVRIRYAPEVPVDSDYVFDAESVSYPMGSDRRDETLTQFSHPIVGAALSDVPIDARPLFFNRSVLDFFARRYFPIPELKEEQVILLERALRGESGLGVLPTAFGKSLVYQLYSLLVPRTTLVISPLTALIRDQVGALELLGLGCVDYLTGSDSRSEKERKLRRFAEHRYRLLYIAPERLLIKGFCDELVRTVERSPVGALVVDEAHCVSEWGHDFRPSYLQVQHVHSLLQTHRDAPVPLIALTATASDPVRQDIERVLSLPPGSTRQLASSDRRNISLSVHPVSSPRQQAEQLQQLFTTILPAALNQPLSDLVPTQALPRYENAGVVFGLYANPLGRHTGPYGVHSIAEGLKTSLGLPEGLVKTHSSTPPSVCPRCHGPDLAQKKERGRDKYYKCLRTSCLHEFRDPIPSPDWDSVVRARQDAFKRDEFPLLVATKGYGMGIDKRNLRFIVHYALASGLESYYQEAGRAGRDGEQAHVALMYVPPHPDCMKDFIETAEGEPPCISDPGNFQFWKCPFFQEHLCHYGLQARFIKSSYPGLNRDLQNVRDVLDRFREAGAAFNVGGTDEAQRTIQLALCRLQEVGVLDRYSIEYLRNGSKVRYAASLTRPSNADIIERTRAFLKGFGRTDERPNSETRDLTKMPEYSASDLESRTELILACVRLVLRRVYDVVPRMRYTMLRNELAYASCGERGECRRIIIRSVFDVLQNVPSSDYRCGFCDVCVPSLEFGIETANVPLQDDEAEDLSKRLSGLLKSLDWVTLEAYSGRVVEKNIVAGILARVLNRLETEGTNLAALYLAGSLLPRRGRDREAFGYLHFGFQECLRRGNPKDDALVFSGTAAQLSGFEEEAFAWLLEAGGQWDTPEGWPALASLAEERFGPGSPVTRSLVLKCAVQVLREDLGPIENEAQVISDKAFLCGVPPRKGSQE